MGFQDRITDIDRAVQGNLGGESIVYRPRNGSPVSVPAMFDLLHADVSLGNAGVETEAPSVFVLLADLPTVPENDDPIVTVRGQDYRVHSRQEDPTGRGVRLFLHIVAG